MLAAYSTERLAAEELDPKSPVVVSLFGRGRRFRKALESQVHEHGRWRHRRSSE
jgi:hypothetical protein